MHAAKAADGQLTQRAQRGFFSASSFTISSFVYLSVVCASVLLIGMQPAQAQVQTLDEVVAIVDDDIILASELGERLALIQQGLERRNVEIPPDEVLFRETLDRLILESIQL